MEQDKRPAPPARKGRGAVTNNDSHRFNLPSRQADGDWLDDREALGDSPTKLRTQVTTETPKSILSFNTSPDIPFDRSINAYRGCEHGCIYCYARPTHAYHDLSPGLDFETKLFAKPNAAQLLRETLAKPKYRPAPIALGTNTDPYQPIEKRYRITRTILDVMLETRHPVGITTKSNKVIDDSETLAALAALELTAVAISVTTLDPQTARLLEPRAPSPVKRLAAVRHLRALNIPVHVSIAPVIPAITDYEIESIVEAAVDNGAQSVSITPMRLPHEVAPLFEQWLEAYFPDRKNKVMNIIASLRDGKKNDPDFHSRMKGKGPWAKLLHHRLAIASRKHGLGKARFTLRTDLFQRPLVKGSQMELF
ncbi:PA0069 family radical SAM protein [Parasphingorhabdus cellanae]|uniref:PA0069 family radical SAM protein n=1 Tax=Parasphingorhabdus cellanae TaxID=2806553 RepID=A0ABX7T3G6_9SPHN|nr:PA0069 family radical SAM protein [Parasphingorhabdus cellanae]QTD56110.1 PA0069 family radical SAM protein [Parasphingorhabdus cellanae]